MEPILGSKCFLSSSYFIITIISVYGAVGSIFNYFQSTNLPNVGDWPFNVRPMLFAFILIQCLCPLVGIFGMLAACKSRPIFLFGSGSILLAIATCSCIFGIVSFQVSSQDISESYYKTFRKDINRSEVVQWINEMQWQHSCCGVYSYMDWYSIDDSVRLSKIPISCCRRDLPSNQDCRVGIDAGGRSNSSSAYMEVQLYTQGCSTFLSKTRMELLWRLGLEMSICGVIALVVAIFLYAGVTRFLGGGNSLPVRVDRNGPSSGNSGGNAAANADENNNLMASRNGFPTSFCSKTLNMNYALSRGKRRDIEKLHGKRRKSMPTSPFASTQLHSNKFSRTLSRNNMLTNISRSKSFIIGDAPSNLLTPIYEEKDPELLRKNVDMLWYQALDKNISTVSTTPLDLCSMLLPGLQNKYAGLHADEDMYQSQRNAVQNIASERQNTPTLSRNGSASLMNNNTKVQINCESSGVGQSSPSNSLNKQARNRAEEQLNDHDDTTKVEQVTNNDETGVNNNENVIMSAADLPNVASTTQHSTQNLKFLNPTSSVVRSSTLATIQEESESTKGSPKSKGASPDSTCHSPETVSPQSTQIELFPGAHKQENVPCSAEAVNRKNNNDTNYHFLNDDEPKPTL